LSNALPSRPIDATLTVTKAARLLGVHPNTVRAWSDAGRLRYYRINPRGDRRYRLSDLQRFLTAAEVEVDALAGPWPIRHGPGGRRGGPHHRASGATSADRRYVAVGRPDVMVPSVDPLANEHHAQALALIDSVVRQAVVAADLDDDLRAVATRIRDTFGHYLVALWELRDDRLVPRAIARADDIPADRLVDRPRAFGVLGAALADAVVGRGAGRATTGIGAGGGPLAVLQGGRTELAVVIPGGIEPWGVLHLVAETTGPFPGRDVEVASVVADTIATITTAARRWDEAARQLHRADALRRVAGDIGSRLDLDRILSGLVQHAMALFEADRGAVYLRRSDGRTIAEVSRGLSATYLGHIRELRAGSLPAEAVAERRPLFALDYRNDPRGADLRAAVIQEGFDTLCSAPLLDGDELLGLLNVYHDRPHAWSDDDLETMAALATQASVAIRAAQDFEQMASWAAQLQSIQQLGARLNRLSDVHEIGMAIATELRQLIDYHNVRVYRLVGSDLIPVAMKGQVGEYTDETPDMLRVSVGEGITGWVAEHAIAVNLGDAANDPRADTIPGTEDDLDESMLLAPMTFDDRVMGVLVLSKLGLDQFTDDDLRLLVIYASFAAQAMANADTTEQLREQSAALERQVRGQRELLQITESILMTLDGRAVLESITDRLGGLIACDNIAIEVVDPSTGLLTPLTARGVHAAGYLEPWEPGETGIATWVVDHNEPTYIDDERNDPRVNHFREEETQDGSLVVVPLRGRDGAIGVLTVERLGVGNTFAPDEFELVQLFAAQVSIALQNAEVFRAVEIRAQTDDLTGLLNHGTFEDRLARSVHAGQPFSLIMLDLDHFREVNNTLGHQAGDRLLREIATRLGRAAGREPDQIFRYGGDEFTFLLPGTDAKGAMLVAKRASQSVKTAGESVSASIGIATFPIDGDDTSSILLAADRACFVAKRSGRDRIATAAEGLALAAEFSLQAPTPIDPTT
jgi:diguanylate cyclase (GGDEF)-like protein/excisionase family DNA binding protein